MWHPTTWRLIGCLLLGCFSMTMNGYDGSLFGGLTANKEFLAFFHGSNSGTWAALNSAMYQIGSVCALPFVGPFVDTWGRKVGMMIGVWIIIVGVILNGTTLQSHSIGQLQGGRFILGFGVNIVCAAGPIYVVETAHPAWRAVITAYCVSSTPRLCRSRMADHKAEHVLVHGLDFGGRCCSRWPEPGRQRILDSAGLAAAALSQLDRFVRLVHP